jgi:hypothetical protein
VQDKCARKADLTNLDLTGTTNTTGSTISSGTYFYLNGVLVRAKKAIASGATFTLNTNYEVVTDGALNKSVIYATDEHVVGKWIDGSVLYEKTVDCGALPNATTKNVAHNISNLGYVVSVNGTARSASTPYTYETLPISHPTLSNVNIYVSNTHINLETSYNWGSVYNSSYVTIRYTKTS